MADQDPPDSPPVFQGEHFFGGPNPTPEELEHARRQLERLSDAIDIRYTTRERQTRVNVPRQLAINANALGRFVAPRRELAAAMAAEAAREREARAAAHHAQAVARAEADSDEETDLEEAAPAPPPPVAAAAPAPRSPTAAEERAARIARAQEDYAEIRAR